jgi:hypothetical protein
MEFIGTMVSSIGLIIIIFVGAAFFAYVERRYQADHANIFWGNIKILTLIAYSLILVPAAVFIFCGLPMDILLYGLLAFAGIGICALIEEEEIKNEVRRRFFCSSAEVKSFATEKQGEHLAKELKTIHADS